MDSPRDPIAAYLYQVGRWWWIMPPDVRAEYRQELRLHLEEIANAEILCGLDPETAARNAVARFGDPEKLGQGILSQWQPTRNSDRRTRRRSRGWWVKAFAVAIPIGLEVGYWQDALTPHDGRYAPLVMVGLAAMKASAMCFCAYIPDLIDKPKAAETRDYVSPGDFKAYLESYQENYLPQNACEAGLSPDDPVVQAHRERTRRGQERTARFFHRLRMGANALACFSLGVLAAALVLPAALTALPDETRNRITYDAAYLLCFISCVKLSSRLGRRKTQTHVEP